MTLTVFTAVVGRTDQLKLPTVVNPSARYVCFSDRPQAVAPYKCVPVDAAEIGPRLLSRRLKILADHPALGDPDVVLWHDAAFRMRVDPLALAAKAFAGDAVDMVAFIHPHRSQIEDEAVAIAGHGWIPKAVLDRQVATYRGEGFTQTAITSTGFSLRQMTPRVRAFNRLWWNEVARWGWRDQMSVDYAAWKTGLRTAYIPGHYRDNPYAQWYKW